MGKIAKHKTALLAKEVGFEGDTQYRYEGDSLQTGGFVGHNVELVDHAVELVDRNVELVDQGVGLWVIGVELVGSWFGIGGSGCGAMSIMVWNWGSWCGIVGNKTETMYTKSIR